MTGGWYSPRAREPPSRPRNFNRSFERLRERAGMKHLTLHDLRHSMGSLLLAQGVDMYVVSKLMGHSSIKVTIDIYGHLHNKVRQDAANRMDKILGKGPDSE